MRARVADIAPAWLQVPTSHLKAGSGAPLTQQPLKVLSLLGAFAKAIGQLTDPSTRRVLWISIALAVLVFIGLWALVGYLLTTTALFELAWLETAIDVLGGLATLVITWLLFPAVLSGCIGILLERVADAVERRHYPSLPVVRDMPMGEMLATTARFLVIVVGLNLLILVFLPFPPVFPFVYYGVNGYLLGREYFEMVALRRADTAEVRALRSAYRGRLFVAGLIVAFLLTVPIINLLAPIIGTAAMVHVFQGLKKKM